MMPNAGVSPESGATAQNLGMVRIITLDREYGSGGAEIAKALADRLTWRLWDQDLTNAIAREMDCEGHVVEAHEEKRDPLYYRLLKSFMRGSYEGSHNIQNVKMADTDCIREVSERIVRRAADKGECVIVGRGSAYYLQDRRDAFHVFIYAPVKDKIRRLRARGKSAEDAAHLAETVDQERADFIKQYFNVDWPDRHKFHLMVNSAIGEQAAVDLILNAIELHQKPSVEAATPQAAAG